MKKVHTIHTPRLILRTPQLRDAAAYVHLNTNPENNVFDPIPPDRQGRAHTIERYETDIVKWREATEKGEAAFMVVTLPGYGDSADAYSDPVARKELEGSEGEIENDIVIGMTGFNELKWKTRASGADSVGEEYLEGNIGVLIDAPKYTKKGYGKEALYTIIDYGFTTMGCDILLAYTLVENKPFRELMKSLGAGEGKEVDVRDSQGKIKALYELERKDWV
jgi:RimJ/RimL family protein N-acetyltransferase